MSNYSPIALRTKVLILTLILGAFGPFNTGLTLAAKNKGAATANAKAGNSQQIGQLIVNGSVTVNDKKAITGSTIFTDSRIVVACAKGSSAIVNLGRLGRIELTAGAKLTLRFGEGLIGGDLAEGNAVVSAPAGVKVEVSTPGGVASSSGGAATVTPVVAQRGVRCVPVAVGPSGPNTVLSSGALTAALLGVGGGTAAIVALASGADEASATRP